MKKTAKNFAIWTALQSEIKFFTDRPSYCGGANRRVSQKEQAEAFCDKFYIKKMYGYIDSIEILKQIKVIGIDWDNCSTPESDSVPEFHGTFAYSIYVDIVTGKLALVDGQVIDYYARCKLNMDQFESMQQFFGEAE